MPYQAIKTRDRTVYCSPVVFRSQDEVAAWVARSMANFNIPAQDVRAIYELENQPPGAIIWPDGQTLLGTPPPSNEPVTIVSVPPDDEPGLPAVVLGGNNRQPVNNAPGVSPAKYVGRIVSTWRDGTMSWGTGTLLYDQYVLTCGHNLFDVEKQWHCTSATFQLGLTKDGNAQGIAGSNPIDLAKWKVQPEYVQQGGAIPPATGINQADITAYLYDIAVARMAERAPTGNSQFDVVPVDDDTLFNVPGLPCAINGYSSDLDNTGMTQYTRNGNTLLYVDDFVAYRMSTMTGDSGSPVYYQPPMRPYWLIVSVHVTGVQDSPGQANGFNFGPRLYGRNYTFIQDSLQEL